MEMWADTMLCFSSNWKHYFSEYFSLAAARKSFSPSSSSWSRFSIVWYSPAGTFDGPCKSPYRHPAMRPVALLSPVDGHTNTCTTYKQFTFTIDPVFLVFLINISDYKIARPTQGWVSRSRLDRWWVFVKCLLTKRSDNMLSVLGMNLNWVMNLPYSQNNLSEMLVCTFFTEVKGEKCTDKCLKHIEELLWYSLSLLNIARLQVSLSDT